MSRDRVVDALRAGSLLVVVAGHWLMADVTVVGGEIVAGNALSALPALQPLTWLLQVMPVFFIAGGFANLTVWRRIRGQGGGYRDYLAGRSRRLLAPVLVFAVPVLGVLGPVRAVGMATEDIVRVAWVLAQPLWFLVVYFLVTAVAPAMARWHGHRPVLAVAAPAAAAMAVDGLRLAGHADELAIVNFALVWLAIHQLGFWYADGRLRALGRGGLLAVAAGALTALTALTWLGPYSVSMVGLPGEMSNMNPPTVCLLLLGTAQAAAIELARPRLAAWLRDPRRWAAVRAVGVRAMPVYLWHLVPVVAVAGAALATGLSLPAAGTAEWWLTRPLWVAVLGAVLAVLVALVGVVARQGNAMSSVSGSSASKASVRSGSV